MWTSLVLSGAFVNKALCQDPVYWQITDEDGLPSMTVYEIAQDDLGYIWVGTSEGIAKYDGGEFTFHKHPEQIDNEIVTLQKDKAGRIWYSNLSQQTFFIEKDSLFQFSSIAITPGLEIASYNVESDELIFHFRDKKEPDSTYLFLMPCKTELTKVKLSKEDLLAVPTESPLFKLDDDRCAYNFGWFRSRVKLFENKTYSLKDFEDSYRVLNKVAQFSYFKERDGHLCAFGEHLYTVDLKTKSFNFSRIGDKVNNIFQINNQTCLATKNGFYLGNLKEDLRSWKHYLKDYEINYLFVDKEGSIWVSTNRNGILVIPSLSFLSHWGNKRNAQAFFIGDINENDQFYIGKSNGEIILMNNGSKTVERSIHMPSDYGRIRKIIEGDINLIGCDRGLFRVRHIGDEKGVEIINISAVKDMIVDHNNNLWVASSHATKKIPITTLLNNFKFQSTKENNVFISRTYALEEDFQNRIWVGTTTGLYYYFKDSVYPFLVDGEHLPYSITDILETKDSSIWVATNDDGLLRIKNGVMVYKYDTNNHLKSNKCNVLNVDARGNLWIGTSKGLYKTAYPYNQLNLFDTYDGLPSNDVITLNHLAVLFGQEQRRAL